MTLNQYLKNKKMTRKKFYDLIINRKYPINFTFGTFQQWVSEYRYPLPESAYWISQATDGELSVEEILYPPKRRIKLEAMAPLVPETYTPSRAS